MLIAARTSRWPQALHALLALCACAPATFAAVTLPVEVMGAAPLEVTITVPATAGASANRLRLVVHNLGYQEKASARINGGAWIALDNATATVDEPARAYGGVGGAYATIALTVPVGGGVNGSNQIAFRFNASDGTSSGFRVLGVNLLDASGAQLVPANAFVDDDPATWTAPLPGTSDITRGDELWDSAMLRTSPGGELMKATCADCHAVDGRDLRYFNYSNTAIIARARFHGLEPTQAQQIASYIRSLPGPNPGRPWNPPFQPGPGQDARPAAEWSAGAGLAAVLADDKDTVAYLPGAGVDRAALTAGNHILPVNLREIPIAFQLPDWNHWLPRIHPRDAIGDAALTSRLFTAYERLRAGLSGTLPGISAATYRNLHLRGDIDAWHAAAARSSDNPLIEGLGSGSDGWTVDEVTRIYAVPVWTLVKQWELMREFDLEALGPTLDGYNGEARQWYSNRFVFDASPHILGLLDAPPVTGDAAGTLINAYFANAWYEIQLLLNPGSRNGRTGGFHTIDWAYMAGLFGDLKRASGRAEPVRSWRFTLKAMEQHDAGYGPDGAGPDASSLNAWWGWNLRDNLARHDRTGSSTASSGWSAIPQRNEMARTLRHLWLEQNGRYLGDQWYALSFDRAADGTYGLTAHDYRFDTTSSPDTNDAEILRGEITAMRASYLLPEPVLNGMAEFGRMLWPLGDWQALKRIDTTIAVPGGIIATAGVEQVTVSWDAVPGATTYNVKRASGANGTWPAIGLLVTGTSFVDRERTPGRTLAYRVSANVGASEGPDSGQVAATPHFGLVSRWRFDEGSGTRALDDGPAANHGVLINAPARITGRSGGGGGLTTATDQRYVGVRRSLHRWLGGTCSLTAWVRTAATGGSDSSLGGIAGTRARELPAKDQDIRLGGLDNQGRIVAQYGWSKAFARSAPLNDGAWHHVVITRRADDGRLTLYVDGVQRSQVVSGAGIYHRRCWSIGRIDEDLACFPGDLDDVRIYDHELTATDAAAMAALGEPAAPAVPPASGTGSETVIGIGTGVTAGDGGGGGGCGIGAGSGGLGLAFTLMLYAGSGTRRWRFRR